MCRELDGASRRMPGCQTTGPAFAVHSSPVPTYGMGQAAELLGVSPDTAGRWTAAGGLPIARTGGGHRRIDGAALADFAASLAIERQPPAIVSESARNRFTGLVTTAVRRTAMA